MRSFIIFIFIGVCNFIHAQVVNVSSSAQLQTALNNALLGQTILIADGTYNATSGNFTPPIGVNGSSSQPIIVKGSRNAILTTGDSAHGYGFWLRGNRYWVLKGFTTRYCKNGVVVDSSQYITVDSVQSIKNGQSGINLRKYSSYCTVKNCFIDSAGLFEPGFGEGIYIGSANSNWCDNTSCNPDTCNYNIIENNTFGSAVAAENIDIKEGTKWGIIRGNVFNGVGLANDNSADSWIDVKGNYYLIENNLGNNSFLDGFQTHIVYTGWGNYNTFRNNALNVNAAGYGIRIQTSNSLGTANNNVVCNTNVTSGATAGIANVSLQNCYTQTTYYWNGGSAGSWSDRLSWNTITGGGGINRNAPSPTDILIFNGVTTSVTNVPYESIDRLIVQNNAMVNFTASLSVVAPAGGSISRTGNVITGTGTSFNTYFKTGDFIYTDATNISEITSILSATAIITAQAGVISSTSNYRRAAQVRVTGNQGITIFAGAALSTNTVSPLILSCTFPK